MFEANRGQAATTIQYVVRAPNYAVLCGDASCAWRMQDREVAIELLGGHRVRPQGLGRLTRVHRYYRGRRSIVAPTFQRVIYRQVYPGIDMVFRLDGESVEYDWVVAPGASAAAIRMRLRGAERSWLNAQGELVVEAGTTQWKHHAPYIYQLLNDRRVPVQGHFVKHKDGSWGIAMRGQRADVPTVIDPKVSLARFIGGGGGEAIEGIAVGVGETKYYVVGTTTSADLSAPLLAYAKKRDVVVAKIDVTTGVTDLVTYLGGNDEDAGHAIAIDPGSGRIYITGSTLSDDFPIRGNTPPQASIGRDAISGLVVAPDAFVASFDNNLVLINSTYYGSGGKEAGRAIVYNNSYIYVAGTSDSSDFKVFNPLSSTPKKLDAFVVKIFEDNIRDPTGATWGVAFATRFGGSGDDYGVSLDVDNSGNIYLAGHTNSADIGKPAKSTYSYKSFAGGTCAKGGLSADQGAAFPCRDAFLTQWAQGALNSYTINFTTYLGGSRDELASRVRVSGINIFLTGATQSGLAPLTAGTPLPAGDPALRSFPLYKQIPEITAQPNRPGRTSEDYDAFVAGFNASGSQLLFSSTLGGSSADNAESLAVWPLSNGTTFDLIVAGHTASSDFLLKNAAQSLVRQSDGFLARFVYDATVETPLTLATSTFMGGAGVDFFYDVALANQGKKWVAVGGTESADAAATVSGSALQGTRDGWMVVWDEANADLVDFAVAGVASSPNIQLGASITFNITLTNSLVAADDRPRLWVELPESNANATSSLTGCVLFDNFYSCPFTGANSVAASVTVTPSFSGAYQVNFGVGGLFADPTPANNRVAMQVEVAYPSSSSRWGADGVGGMALLLWVGMQRLRRRYRRRVV
ncbi:MAG: SBBP repeat-containing protein [Pseudomonadota bacterium]